MALSFQDWYRAYANQPGMGGSAVSDPVLAQLANNVTNPQYETNFQALLTKLGGIGSMANADREKSANTARRTAWDRGLSDETQVEQAGTKAGNAGLGTADAITYKIKMGPDGRAYRQAYLNTGASFGARGWGGSEEKAAQWKARQDLNTARNDLTDGLSSEQNQSVIKQGTDEGDVIGDISKTVTDYGQWKVDKMPQSPNMGGSGAGGGDAGAGGGTPAAPPAPDRFRGIAVGGVLGKYDAKPNTKTLDAAYLPGNYKINKAGNGKYVVTRLR